MIRRELEKKYGKSIINNIFRGGYLDGCTMRVLKNGDEDIPESDIVNALKEIKGIPHDWD
ncbi:MAG: hypothetical protein AABX11_07735 [Nanoarchaeota archaeon]